HLAGDEPRCGGAPGRSRSREQCERKELSVSGVASPSQDPRAAAAAAYFRDLQGRICSAFESFESRGARFEQRNWSKPEGHRLHGGGESRLMRGEVFEKVGVNVSHVWGEFSAQARAQMPGAQESQGQFVACGISLVAHMSNPYVPAVHMNLRYLRT